MSLQKFDEALDYKLKKVFPNVEMAADEQAFSQAAQDSETVVLKLPLISYVRINNSFNLEQYGNDTRIRTGRLVIQDEHRIKGFPVLLQYQIDIWSDKREEVDAIWRELIQYLYEEPELDVEFDGLGNLESFALRLIDTENSTDYSSFSDKGRLYRQTINIEIPGAFMLFVEGFQKVMDIPVRMVYMGAKEDVELVEAEEVAP